MQASTERGSHTSEGPKALSSVSSLKTSLSVPSQEVESPRGFNIDPLSSSDSQSSSTNDPAETLAASSFTAAVSSYINVATAGTVRTPSEQNSKPGCRAATKYDTTSGNAASTPDLVSQPVAMNPASILVSLLGGGAATTATTLGTLNADPASTIMSLLEDPTRTTQREGSGTAEMPAGTKLDFLTSIKSTGDPHDPQASSNYLGVTTVVIGSHAFVAFHASDSNFLVNGINVSSSSSGVLDAQTVEHSGHQGVVIGSSTVSFEQVATPDSSAHMVPFIAAGKIFTALQLTDGDSLADGVMLGSVTIGSGQAAVVNGVEVSAGSDGLVVGGISTVPLL
jgi:hypothetical protein